MNTHSSSSSLSVSMMDNHSSSGSVNGITDLDLDALTHCASYLEVEDVSNMTMTSKYFDSVASSDPVWRSLYRKQWPFQISVPSSGVKEAYIARHTATQQFKYNDPWSSQFVLDTRPCNLLLFDRNDIILSQGRCQRCFKGHTSTVTTLADRLLGDYGGKLLASGGEDGSICLWSLISSGNRGQHALRTTFYGHKEPIMFLSVARHKASLLVSISKESRVMVWDATRSSQASGCVGMIVPLLDFMALNPVNLLKAFTSAIQPYMFSFEMLPSKSLICTGGPNKAMLWDIRKSTENPKPVTEFGHMAPVSHLHMDPYKVVTGTIMASDINIWDPNTGVLMNSLRSYKPEDPDYMGGCSAMAVSGCRIVTANTVGDVGYLCYKDYTHATSLISSPDADTNSKS
ncbi:hypothetical protein IFM89_023439 [Coptis chinensis]|uniref:Uncharacterized protein n=1 Tax=Coptis chinensis TaxID=261450 RepID=A0A835IY16_9MAGN|nr:hypothetical protein IFM89_023439 [Coptis chinensis]